MEMSPEERSALEYDAAMMEAGYMVDDLLEAYQAYEDATDNIGAAEDALRERKNNIIAYLATVLKITNANR